MVLYLGGLTTGRIFASEPGGGGGVFREGLVFGVGVGGGEGGVLSSEFYGITLVPSSGTYVYGTRGIYHISQRDRLLTLTHFDKLKRDFHPECTRNK